MWGTIFDISNYGISLEHTTKHSQHVIWNTSQSLVGEERFRHSLWQSSVAKKNSRVVTK
jgi:hypothetical protein